MNVIIIGATSGIGKAIAELYAEKGHQIAILGRRDNLLKDMCNNYHNMIYSRCDITDVSNCIVSLEQIYNKFRTIDLFFVSSGIGWMNENFDWEKDLLTIETNVKGWTAIINWAYQKMQHQQYGKIAAITSIASIRGLCKAPSYSATKAYQSHYLEALRQKSIIDQSNIQVCEIQPGFVKTALLASPEKLFWVMPVDKAARQIVCGLDRNHDKIIVTKRWLIISFFLKIIPNTIIGKICSINNNSF